MKYLLPFLFVLFLVGCRSDKELRFYTETITGTNCGPCPKVTVTLPVATGNDVLQNTVNGALREEAIDFLIYDDSLEVDNIQKAIMSFSKGYAHLNEKYGEETTPWEANIKGTVVFEDHTMLSIRLDTYQFTGGAHGYSSIRYLNFDKQSGTEINNDELFLDKEKFLDFAETQFRKQEHIPEEASINSTGLMFEGETFYLPDNIGFTEKGVQLLYNPYEVTSFADGPIVLTLPYQQVKGFLAERLKS